jgi:hypothetical protein
VDTGELVMAVEFSTLFQSVGYGRQMSTRFLFFLIQEDEWFQVA